MRLIKLFIICILVLLGVSTALSLLFPSHLRVQRSVNVRIGGGGDLNATKRAVMGVLGNVRTWEHWETFVRATDSAGRVYEGSVEGVGAGFRAGKLSASITAIGEDSVHCHWTLASGKQFESGYYLFVLNNTDSVTVQSWMDFHFRWYPWERLGILLYDKKLGPALEESLNGLKGYVEKSP